MHGQHDTCEDLRNEHEAQNAAEGVHIVQVARRRIGYKGIVDEARQRKPFVHPFLDAGLRRVCGVSTTHVLSPQDLLADPDDRIGSKRILRDVHVFRCRAAADAASSIIGRAMARAEPAAKGTGFTERHTTKMRADPDHHEPVFLPSPAERARSVASASVGRLALRALGSFRSPSAVVLLSSTSLAVRLRIKPAYHAI